MVSINKPSIGCNNIMNIICHRGLWREKKCQNTIQSFSLAFEKCFGVETDIRDYNGMLVISHETADKSAVPFVEFLSLYKALGNNCLLALNIKADGLQELLFSHLDSYEIKNYFVFDMSVPDALLYAKLGINTYTRHSEHERVPAYYEKACGVWLDEFDGHWVTGGVIEQHLSASKSLCIVSPELHGRSFDKEWQHYRKIEDKIGKDRLTLCTDFPEHAMDFFNA